MSCTFCVVYKGQMRRGSVMSLLCFGQRPDEEVLGHFLVIVLYKDAR